VCAGALPRPYRRARAPRGHRPPVRLSLISILISARGGIYVNVFSRVSLQAYCEVHSQPVALAPARVSRRKTEMLSASRQALGNMRGPCATR
jgi:hypothetical protein